MTPIKPHIRTVPHYPKSGVMFRDITTLLKDAVGFRDAIRQLVHRYAEVDIDRVAGIEARGFIIGAALASQLGVGFVPIRKKGKLPAETIGQEYDLEYGTDRIEMHVDAISPGDRILAGGRPDRHRRDRGGGLQADRADGRQHRRVLLHHRSAGSGRTCPLGRDGAHGVRAV
jgi:hypothetical protein